MIPISRFGQWRPAQFAGAKAVGVGRYYLYPLAAAGQAGVERALDLMQVDPLGLDDVDRRVLKAIIEKYNGGPVGLNTIAAAISEEADTIMDVVEPYLLQLGFLDRTPQGRVATKLAYSHLEIAYPEDGAQPRLL